MGCLANCVASVSRRRLTTRALPVTPVYAFITKACIICTCLSCARRLLFFVGCFWYGGLHNLCDLYDMVVSFFFINGLDHTILDDTVFKERWGTHINT